MSEKPMPTPWILAMAAILNMNPVLHAQSNPWPTRPSIAIPYTSYFGTAYLPGTPVPKKVIDAALGDAERGVIVLHASHTESEFADIYKGVGTSTRLTFRWRFRTGEISYQWSLTQFEVDGSKKSTNSTAPIGIHTGELHSFCRWNDGSRTISQKLKTYCSLVHVVTGPAKAEPLHAWVPGKISVIFPTDPIAESCSPTDRVPRIVAGQVNLARKGETEFDLAVLGVTSETTRPEAPWTICLNQPILGNTTRVSDDR